MVSFCQRRGLRETETLFSKPEAIILSQHHPSMAWLLLCPVIRTINKKEAARRKCRFLPLTSSPTDLTGLGHVWVIQMQANCKCPYNRDCISYIFIGLKMPRHALKKYVWSCWSSVTVSLCLGYGWEGVVYVRAWHLSPSAGEEEGMMSSKMGSLECETGTDWKSFVVQYSALFWSGLPL